MQINIKSSNFELTEAIRSYAQKKIDKMEKFLGTTKVITAEIELEKTSNHHNKGEIYRAEINLELPQELLRIEKTEKDLYKAIDKAESHMVLLLKKYKEKRIDRKKKSAEAEKE
jgi:putative sigma-54 modulation protein